MLKRLLLLCLLMFAAPLSALADSSGAATPPGNAGQRSDLTGCVYETSPATASTGQQRGVECDSTGHLLTSASGSNVGGYEFHVSTTPTVTAGSYVAGKCMGGVQAVSVARTSGGSGILNKIVYSSKAGSTSAVTFYVFKSLPTTACTDTATFTLDSADLSRIVGIWSITPAAVNSQTQTETELTNLVSHFVTSGNTNLYVYIVSAATQTPGSTSDIVFVLQGIPD